MGEYSKFLADLPFPESEMKRLAWRISELQKHIRPGAAIAEIGVFRGHFSEVLLERLKPSVLYMVDVWCLQGEHFDFGDIEYAAFGRLTTQQAKDDAKRRVARFMETDIRVVERAAIDFAEELRRQDRKLDAVYLDTSHTYEATLTELHAFRDLIAPAGVIAGDDWEPDQKHSNYGIVLAVNDFVRETDFDIVVAGPALQYCLRRRGNSAGEAGQATLAGRPGFQPKPL